MNFSWRIWLGLGAACLATAPARARAAELSWPTPVAAAFIQPLQALEAGATADDALSQQALSLLYARGMRGLPLDPVRAASLKTAALRPRSSQVIPTYMAGLNGAPVRVSMINVATGGLPPSLARTSEACMEALSKLAADDALLFPSGEIRAAGERRSRAAKRVCGDTDFDTLLIAFVDAMPWRTHALPQCAEADAACQTLAARTARLNARSPEAEAAAAVKAGDFRLGAFNHFFNYGHNLAGWRIVAGQCATWSFEITGKRFLTDDRIRPGEREHARAALAFLAAYNRRVLSDPAYPYADLCAPDLVKPAAAINGRPATAGQAARSRDPARLTELPAGADLNAKDLFGKRPLDWAVQNKDLAMVQALVVAGADPNLFDHEAPSPLALAIDAGDEAVTRALLERGARMQRVTGLCPRPTGVQWVGPDTEIKPDDPRCRWTTLLLLKGRIDLLESHASTFDPMMMESELITNAFVAAIKAGDKPLARRLAPLARNRQQSVPTVMAELLTIGDSEFTRAFALGDGAADAHSEAEARLWRAAAQAQQDEALAYLYANGADLNLLSPAKLAACDGHAMRGDLPGLNDCVSSARAVRTDLETVIASGNEAAFVAPVSQVADVAERGKVTLVQRVARSGSAPMLKALLSRGASPDAPSISWNPMSSTPRPEFAPAPALSAAERGETGMLRMLVDAGAKNLAGIFSSLGNLGSGRQPEGSPLIAEDDDTSTWPDGPAPEKFQAMERIAAEMARRDGPQAFAPAFSGAVYNAYDDVLRLMLRHGFSAASQKEVWTIWSNWAGHGNACKPTTGRLLLQMDLPSPYATSETQRSSALHQLAATCRNPRSLAVLVEAGLDLNLLNTMDQTPLDTAISYNRSVMAAALRAAGAKTAKELGKDTEHARARGQDLDLDQSD